MHLGIVPSVHMQKKIGHKKRVDVCTQKIFEARLSQARSDVVSSVAPVEEQRLKTRCWVAAVGPKCKGRLYSIGDLTHTYKCGDYSFMQHMQGSSSLAQDSAEINQLREELHQSKEEMRIFQSIVLQFLPFEARNIIHQH
ncbi:hypothetical protein GmHk_12G034607 [Glycine max]|nr:hypothetical protein GmHk_12G034607 [Glycine max]